MSVERAKDSIEGVSNGEVSAAPAHGKDGTASAAHEQGHEGAVHGKPNIVIRYLSCLCPPDEGNEAEADASALRQATTVADGDCVDGEVREADAGQTAHRRPNWLMRVLLKEHYTDGSLIALKTDIFSGVTLAVAQVAPSVAFALMGHGQPLVGLFSSFFLGLIACICGGRPGQITAIAGAVVVLYPDLVDEHGFDAVCAVSIIAGCFITLPGIFRVAGLVRLLPSSLMVGFCNGLGASMVVHQIPQFKDKDGKYPTGILAFKTAVICIVSFAIMMILPYFTTMVPSAFVAIFVGTAMQYVFDMKTVTIGDLYELHGDFPRPRWPDVNWSNPKCVSDVMTSAVLTAIISCIESFMAGYKMQQLTETTTNFERESLALGLAHFVNGFFNGMPGCVVYGPCILNVECGSGTRRLSSLICAILMVIIPVALYAVIGLVPMAALSAVMFGVSSKTGDWRMLAMVLLQRISLQDSIIAILVTSITVAVNLAIGAASGFAAALVFFMWNMSRGRVSMAPERNVAPYSSDPNPEAVSLLMHEGRRNYADGTLDEDLPLVDLNGRTEVDELTEDDRTGRAREEKEVLMSGKATASRRRREGTDTLSRSLPLQEKEEAVATNSPSTWQEPSPADAPLPQKDDVKSVELTSISVRVSAPHKDTGHASPNESLADDDTVTLPVSPSSTDDGLGLHRTRPPARNPTAMDVDFLDIRHDADFDEIKVLRIKMRGVLFFGSCMEFVDGMIKLLHVHHSQIFLKVTDLVLDFQHGMMPIMDFSASEALEDVARIFYKRGIRTHTQNMDPLSWACFERCRRYFPTVAEDNVNNVKHLCCARRVFKVASRRKEVRVSTSTGTGSSTEEDDRALDDDVFARANHSFVRTLATPPPARKKPSPAAATSRKEDCGDASAAHAVVDDAEEGVNTESGVETAVHSARSGKGARAVASSRVAKDEPVNATEASAVERLTAIEEQVPFLDSVKVGFHIYRPEFGITVLVFDTVDGWIRRCEVAQAGQMPSPFELGLTERKPFNRQFGDVGKLWWKRLRNRDVPLSADIDGDGVVPSSPQQPNHAVPALRKVPTVFMQVPRFPGQGYAKSERFHRREWAMIKRGVCKRLFQAEPPADLNVFVARMQKFERDVVDGFI